MPFAKVTTDGLEEVGGQGAQGPTGLSTITVKDIDGTPSVAAGSIEVTNGAVTDQGGGVARISVIPPSLFDAKGDLIVASANDTAGKLAVGTNGQVLTADSGEATGVKWAAASGGAYDERDAWILG